VSPPRNGSTASCASKRPDVILLDAPVAGSRGPAEKGHLVILASGPERVRDRIAPVFDAIGQRTAWVGSAGAGSRIKMVSNLLLAFVAKGSPSRSRSDTHSGWTARR
jgi:3-hydroxyisobutyrate dehydrogenase